ncbi:uncharacterized protein [Rutidosis leptorrhynchoides]|uniref:uncharacterized protein n=1 Tax=Rutidosis leptorrhynchoides TaxID=125765 RepID=UPI003A9A10B9
MTVNVCSAYEPCMISPRISFSHDLNNQSSEIATTTTATATSTTFDFCITSNLDQPITSADELFFNGVLLPTQIKKEPKITCPISKKILVSENEDVHRKRLKELLCDDEEEQDKSSSRSFWMFNRTMSLNSNSSTKGPKRLFKSLSLKRMLRSNSTDSPTNRSCNEAIKVVDKEPSTVLIQTPPVEHSCNDNNSSRRFVPRKNSYGGYDRGKKIHQVVNIPATYNRNLFGLGALFCNSKAGNKSR